MAQISLKVIPAQVAILAVQHENFSVSIKHGLRTGYKIRTRYKTRTRKYGLGIKHGQGIKRGLRTGYKILTTDYFGKNRANWF